MEARMIGTLAERNLLASIMAMPRLWRMTEGLVNRGDFSDDRLGIIYEQAGHLIGRGESFGVVEVVAKLPEWGVRGLDAAELFAWETPETYVHGISEYARAVRSEAVRRTAVEVGQYLVGESRDHGVDAAEVLTKARGMLDTAIDGASTGQLAPKSLGEILDGTDSYDWVIPGLLERQDRLILTGAEGAGKTTLARQICVMAAAGLHPLRREVDVSTGRKSAQLIQPARVLVVDAENTEKQWRRATRHTARIAAEDGALDPKDELMVVAGHRIDVTRGSHLGEIHRMVDHYKPDLLYIGPLYKITHGAIMTDDDAAPLLVALDSLRERGLTLMMEAHASKGDGHGTRDLRPRGSAALMGWPEFGLGLHPQDERTVELKRWRGDRDERGWPKFLERGRDWPWEEA